MQNEPVLVSLAWNTTPYVPDANASQAHPTFSNFVNLFVSLHNYKNEVRNTNIEKSVGSPVLHTLVDKDASVCIRKIDAIHGRLRHPLGHRIGSDGSSEVGA